MRINGLYLIIAKLILSYLRFRLVKLGVIDSNS
jgi:hypothetical protein